MRTSSTRLSNKSRVLLNESSMRKELARRHRDIAVLAGDAALQASGTTVRRMLEAKRLEHEAQAARQDQRSETALEMSGLLFQLAVVRKAEEKLEEYAGHYLTV